MAERNRLEKKYPEVFQPNFLRRWGLLVGAGLAPTMEVFVAARGLQGLGTGLASVVTGVLFLGAMFLTPLTSVVPIEVAASALVVVGTLMSAQIREINFKKFSVGMPAFLTMITMPLTYSIANGIGVGFIVWVLVNSASGRAKKIHPLMWLVAAGFLVYFARGPISDLLGG